ncbi:MAG: hypothetical protein LBS19_16825, partial [Clostridiales bacterium]|nr:hypothetical protein [Clostridiales bacterium]
SFTLARTPPFAPILTYPVSADVDASGGVPLQWEYNSQYDLRASKYDLEYWIDADILNPPTGTLNTDGAMGYLLPASLFADRGQHTVRWRVMAYGEFGDESLWSEVAEFWTIGIPVAPVVVRVTNSSRPTVTFSAVNLVSWELEILQNGEPVYVTGSRPFEGSFTHKVTDYLPNGNYVARMRISNAYRAMSGWGSLAFTISVTAPPAPKLRMGYNTKYHIPLIIDGTPGGTVLVYRAEKDEDKYTKIARTDEAVWDDYTAAPGVTYKYFVRAVDDSDSFADSNIESAEIMFKETAIAEVSSLDDMLILLWGLGQKPTKNMAMGFEKTVVELEGREYPLTIKGFGRSKVLAMSFYLRGGEEYGHNADLRKLEALANSGEVLILRDRRHGALYGTITGDLSVSPDRGGFNVGFAFTRTDYDVEAGL